MLMFYDTETTGVPIWGEPSGGDNQPHMVSLSAILATEQGEEVERLDVIVKPDGWIIPPDTIDIHGITEEYAMEHGIDEKEAAMSLADMASTADLRVGHSESFDARILRIAFKRYGMEDYADNEWKAAPKADTCHMSTKLVNLPPTEKMLAKNRKSPKQPTLEEAHEFFFGQKHENAHTSMGDTLATKAVYFEVLRRGREGGAGG